METHKFSLSIKGTAQETGQKAKALATLATKLDAKTLAALARVVETDPSKVALAKQFLGI